MRFILAGRHGKSKLCSCLSSFAIMQAHCSAGANGVWFSAGPVVSVFVG